VALAGPGGALLLHRVGQRGELGLLCLVQGQPARNPVDDPVALARLLFWRRGGAVVMGGVRARRQRADGKRGAEQPVEGLAQPASHDVSRWVRGSAWSPAERPRSCRRGFAADRFVSSAVTQRNVATRCRACRCGTLVLSSTDRSV